MFKRDVEAPSPTNIFVRIDNNNNPQNKHNPQNGTEMFRFFTETNGTNLNYPTSK